MNSPDVCSSSSNSNNADNEDNDDNSEYNNNNNYSSRKKSRTYSQGPCLLGSSGAAAASDAGRSGVQSAASR